MFEATPAGRIARQKPNPFASKPLQEGTAGGDLAPGRVCRGVSIGRTGAGRFSARPACGRGGGAGR
jgi:hypothetical protein